MKEIQEDILRFVAQHWKAGRFEPERAWRRFRVTEKATGPARRPVFGRPVWGYALASALAVLVLGLFLFRPAPRTVIPAAAGVQAVVLPDGSRATLAPGATLSFRRHGFGRRDRAVAQTGKVYYSVERNESLPFEIMASDAFVRVLGTRFQIETDDTITAVDVVDGRVLFAAAPSGARKSVREEDGVILTRGMHAELTPGATVPGLSEAESANPAAWATHVFHYENTPLEEVLRELSDHFGHALRTDARDRRLTGEFEGEELEGIVSLIESALDIHIVID
jgi:transmembrane sensor